MAELLIVVALASFVAMVVAWGLLPEGKPETAPAAAPAATFAESQPTSAGA